MHHFKRMHIAFHSIGFFLLFAVLASLLTQSRTIHTNAATGPSSALTFTLDKSKTVADGSSSINITVTSFWYICNQGSKSNSTEECDYLTPPGYSGNTTVASNENANISGDSGLSLSAASVTTDSSGNATVTVTSTKAGTYNVYSKTSSGFVRAQKAITFTDPAPATVTPSPKQTASQPKPTTATPAVIKPDVPLTKITDSAGVEIKPLEGEKVIFKDKEPIVLSGTTVPKGQVKLYIFSEPQETTVTADDEGNWSYTIASIEPGDHRVEVEVTDPATGETSERAEVIAFSVAKAEETGDIAVATEKAFVEKNNSVLPFVLGIVVILTTCAGAAYWFWRKKHANAESKHTATVDTSPPPPAEEANDVTDTPKPKIEDNE